MKTDLPHLSPEILNGLRDIQADADGFVMSVFHLYLEIAPKRLTAIAQAISIQHPKKLESEAHALKASCLNVGAQVLGALCEDLENLGAQEKTEGALALFKEMEQEFESLKKEILSLPELQKRSA